MEHNSKDKMLLQENSQKHIGIPLCSAPFIDSIPMMSRLLRQLGVQLEWIEQGDVSIVKSVSGSISGVFFVPDATREKDNQGRYIIPAQDFVSKYRIQTVFGFGGEYLDSSTFYTTILFLRESLSEANARIISARISFFKRMTEKLTKQNIFAHYAGVTQSSPII